MSNVGLNTPTTHLGCGGTPPPAGAMPHPATVLNNSGFAIPAGFPGPGAIALPALGMPIGAMAMPAPERFASSMAGGVILGSDGAPTGRIPAGSFVDTKDGTIFGPDGKAMTLPEGSTADFFDLPDIKELMAMTRMATAEAERSAELMKAMGAATTASGPGAKTTDRHSGMQSFVDGQWGPGGVTPIKGGGAAPGCDMDHGATTKAGGAAATGATAATAATSAVGGVRGRPFEQLQLQLNALMDQIRTLTPTPTSGGGGTLVAATGASTLGSVDQLRLSVNDLISVVGQLNLALEAAGISAGGPAKTDAAKSEAPKTETPKVEPPKTEVPSTDSGSGSGSDTTAPPASGSSSSS